MPLAAWSKPVNSGRLRANTASATTSEVHRAACARVSPSASTAAPPRIGSQIRRLRRGYFCTVSGPMADQNGQQHDQADDHRERIVVEVSGLQAAHESGGESDQARGAVDEQSVDQPGIDLARAAAEQEAP